jgi:peptidoglycan/xylan/chitin deacetylase (PgdA/CDA1 family)
MLRKVLATDIVSSLMHGIGAPLVIGLAYHGTTNETVYGIDNIYGKHVFADTFKKHLDFICRHYKIIPLSDVVSALQEEKPLPRKSIFITFDDGYSGNYDTAYSLLRMHDAVATFFVPTHYIETGEPLPTDLMDAAVKFAPKKKFEIGINGHVRTFDISDNAKKNQIAEILHKRLKSVSFQERDAWLDHLVMQLGYSSRQKVPVLGKHARLMNWSQIKELARNGMEIGSHTHRHVILASVSTDLATEELSLSKAIIESKLGISCHSFSYPKGSYPEDGNEKTNQLVKKAGYQSAVYMHYGFNTNNTNQYFLTRCCIGQHTGIKRLKFLLASSSFRLRHLMGKDPSPQAISRLQSQPQETASINI